MWRLVVSAMAFSAALEIWGVPSREMEARKRHPPIRACEDRAWDVHASKHHPEHNAGLRRLTKTHLSDSVGMSLITTSVSKQQPAEMKVNPFRVNWEQKHREKMHRNGGVSLLRQFYLPHIVSTL